MHGCKKNITITRQQECTECHGSGCAAGTSPETCPDCGGRGFVIRQQRTPFGVMQTQQPCSRCGGKGKLVKNPCKVCHGSGKVATKKTLEVSIPMGIDDDQSFALRGMGDAGTNGGPAGDVIVMVSVRPSEVFQRDGYDVWVTVPITYTMEQTVWMSHRDAVSEVPEGFTVTASTDVCPVAAMECPERKIFTTQFHPEVKHSEYGQQLLSNFLFEICGLEPNWSMDNLVETMTAEFREKVGDDRVILALSGGVDSSVVAALGARAVGKQMTCVFINHGLLRKGEPEQVEEVFTKQFDVDFIHVHAEDRYAELLAGVTEPEEKRRIIGTQFWKEFFAVAQQLETDGKPVKYLAQGTIYPDIIESGARKTGGKTATIKSHHNLIPFPEGVHFDLIEPLDHFFKDEVRALGLALGLPGHIVFRQPFPGPGLAIRIIGAVDKEKLEILKNADAIVREELDAYNQRLFEQTGERNSEHSCWQYFAVLPDIKSVGVMGDERTYQRPIILRAVESSDAMTADWAKLPYDVLARISGRIVAEVPGANRVCYDITSKPPATIEWE